MPRTTSVRGRIKSNKQERSSKFELDKLEEEDGDKRHRQNRENKKRVGAKEEAEHSRKRHVQDEPVSCRRGDLSAGCEFNEERDAHEGRLNLSQTQTQVTKSRLRLE